MESDQAYKNYLNLYKKAYSDERTIQDIQEEVNKKWLTMRSNRANFDKLIQGDMKRLEIYISEKEMENSGQKISSTEDEYETPARKSIKKKKKYDTKISRYWFEEFKPWLENSQKGNNAAFCNVCQVDLTIHAGKKDLLRHASSKKHMSNSKNVKNKISILDMATATIFIDTENENKTPARVSIKKKKQCDAGIPHSWFDEFKPWLQNSKKGNNVAFCNACQVDLSINAGKRDLLRHASSKKHMSKFQSIKNEMSVLEPRIFIHTDDENKTPAQESIKKKKKYHTKISHSWFEEFGPWLQYSEKSENLVFCNACQVDLTINAGKKDLLRHASSKKHMSNSKSIENEMNALDMHTIFIHTGDENKTPARESIKKKKKYDTKISHSWFEEFGSWLQYSEKGNNIAFCSICQVDLTINAGKKDLLGHASTKKHMSNSKSIKNEMSALDMPTIFIHTEDENKTPDRESVKKKKKYDTKISPFWFEDFKPWLQESNKGNNVVFCDVCQVDLSILAGKRDLLRHASSKKHMLNSKSIQNQMSVFDLPTSSPSSSYVSEMSNFVPSIGKPAPAFKCTAVVNGEFKDVSLSDYEGKYVVLFFYPLDFTFVCPTEIIAFSERAEEFRAIGCEVLACSTDSQFSHLKWINTPRKEGGLGEMDIPLLADKSLKISKAYGVLNEDSGIPFRGLFIIDGKQTLRQVTINDLPVGRDVDETLRLVQAFQFTDEHGEVCPAGWKPGSKSMKADPKESIEYFESQN